MEVYEFTNVYIWEEKSQVGIKTVGLQVNKSFPLTFYIVCFPLVLKCSNNIEDIIINSVFV